MKARFLGAVVVSLALLSAVPVFATPNVIQYQGRLTNAAGDPSNGSFSIVFAIYAAANGGAALYSETIPNVTVTNGLFTVLIGNITPIPVDLFSGGTKFLGIKVGGDAEMTPRQAVASVPFAIHSTFAQGIPWAIIEDDGSFLRQSGGFTCTRTGTGSYTVDAPVNESVAGFMACSFNSPGAGTSACVVTAFVSGSSFFVRVYDLAGAAIDHDFCLIIPTAVGAATEPPAVANAELIRIDPETNLPIR